MNRSPHHRSILKPFHLSLALALLLPLAACNREPAPADPSDPAAASSGSESLINQAVRRGLEKARQELDNKNIPVGGQHGKGWHVGGRDHDGLPPAEITPQGDLLIDGKPVPVDARQRELLLAHRGTIIAIAETGLELGMQGADLGAKAAMGALKGVFGGDTEAFERQMEAEGKRIEAEALKICGHLPRLLQSQDALAAALPAFAPYATMEQSDIEDCHKEREAAEAQAAVAAQAAT